MLKKSKRLGALCIRMFVYNLTVKQYLKYDTISHPNIFDNFKSS